MKMPSPVKKQKAKKQKPRKDKWPVTGLSIINRFVTLLSLTQAVQLKYCQSTYILKSSPGNTIFTTVIKLIALPNIIQSISERDTSRLLKTLIV